MTKKDEGNSFSTYIVAIATLITAIGGVIAIFYSGSGAGGNKDKSKNSPKVEQTSEGDNSPNISGVGGDVIINK